MFKKRNVNQQNATAIPAGIPRPPQTIINQASSEAGLFAVKAAVVGIGLFIGYHFLLYLIEEMGYRNPVRLMGEVLFGLVGLAALVAGVYFGGTHFFLLWKDYKLQMAVIQAETAKSLALTAGAPALPNERLTEEQKRLFENLAIVMHQAYRDYDEKGEYKGGNDRRPWSKASVLSLAPPRYGRMSYMKADTVRKWLAEHQVIIGEPQKDQINREKFKAWADFRALLENEFDMPVMVTPPVGHSPSLIGRYDSIET